MALLDLDAVHHLPLVQAFLMRRRRHRAKFFLSKIRTSPTMKVLDVGCGKDGNSLEAVLPGACTIIGVDLVDPAEVRIRHPGFTYLRQDARDLGRFADGEFDAAISVGMMEHICDRTALEAISAEMQRVAKQVVVVVPWRFAWIEPHFKLPFFQLLPFRVQLLLVRAFGCAAHRELARDPEAFRGFLRSMFQWLPTREWKRVFEARYAYLSPTLETLVLVKREAKR